MRSDGHASAYFLAVVVLFCISFVGYLSLLTLALSNI